MSEYVICLNFGDNHMESFFSGDIASLWAALTLGRLNQIRPSSIYYVHNTIKREGHLFLPLLSSWLSFLPFFSSQVGESSLQSGNLYSAFMKTCRTLFLGTNQSDQGHSFRGHIGGVVLWAYARSHEDLLKRPLQIDKSEPLLAMWADFTNVTGYI